MRFWDVNSDETPKIIQEQGPVHTLSYSPDGKVIMAGLSNEIVLRDASSGDFLKSLKEQNVLMSAVTYSHDGNFIATGSSYGVIYIWDPLTGRLLDHMPTENQNPITAISYSYDDKLIYVGFSNGLICVWDLSQNKELMTINAHSSAIHSLANSPDGKMIASGSSDHRVKLWNVSSGSLVKRFDGHEGAVFAVDFSPDGQVIASGSVDKKIRLWDVRTGNLLKVLQGHTMAIFTVDYSPDGKLIASGSADNSARLWDAKTGLCLEILHGHFSDVNTLSFNFESKVVATGSYDGIIHLWDLNDPVFRLVYDFDVSKVSDVLGFLWGIDQSNLTFNVKSALIENKKYVSLLTFPNSSETKLQQVVRFLEERCAYKHPERYNCTPAKD